MKDSCGWRALGSHFVTFWEPARLPPPQFVLGPVGWKSVFIGFNTPAHHSSLENTLASHLGAFCTPTTGPLWIIRPANPELRLNSLKTEALSAPCTTSAMKHKAHSHKIPEDGLGPLLVRDLARARQRGSICKHETNDGQAPNRATDGLNRVGHDVFAPKGRQKTVHDGGFVWLASVGPSLCHPKGPGAPPTPSIRAQPRWDWPTSAQVRASRALLPTPPTSRKSQPP